MQLFINFISYNLAEFSYIQVMFVGKKYGCLHEQLQFSVVRWSILLKPSYLTPTSRIAAVQ